MADNNGPTAARLRLAPFGYGPAARPVACETLSDVELNTGLDDEMLDS